MMARNNHIFDDNYDNLGFEFSSLISKYKQLVKQTRSAREALGLRKKQLMAKLTSQRAAQDPSISAVRTQPTRAGIDTNTIMMGAVVIGGVILFTQMQPRGKRRR